MVETIVDSKGNFFLTPQRRVIFEKRVNHKKEIPFLLQLSQPRVPFRSQIKRVNYVVYPLFECQHAKVKKKYTF